MSCRYWECNKLDQDEECTETGSECLEDMCDQFQECRSCIKQNGEDCPHY